MALSLRKNNLIGLPVETAQGLALGCVCDFEFDPIEQKIFRYHVRSKRLIAGLLRHELMIAATQVISLTDEKMVVDDAVARELQEVDREQSSNKAVLPVSGTT